MPISPSSSPTAVSSKLLLTRVLRSRKIARVGVARLVITMTRPLFSTMNRRFVSLGGEEIQTGLVNASPGNAFVRTYPEAAADVIPCPNPNSHAAPNKPGILAIKCLGEHQSNADV